MGINFNIDIKRKFTVNGKEYGSLDEVPEEQRQIVQNALNSTEPGAGRHKITVNGIGYDSPEAMPPDARKVYEEALKKADAVAQRSGMSFSTPRAVDIKPEGSLSSRAITVLLVLAGLVILIKLILSSR
ncbi:MAG: hypothetical protein A2270_01180 [Elusimicrobia bacterium RIFOXYA12_FULL_51_18]|nr:MAG: hypothetical protein A2270_01180 [Elusimicrobia bacterium RIFOXYA12_FULL_51_18]OGS31084.1 MAG: hypothetical protein A2218_01955 [Elusimicrobia bacterium RIFOXYA2_FULL_53_38]